jgi:multidrug efflux system outer membrane protein
MKPISRSLTTVLALLASASLLAGCMVGPDFVKPRTRVPSAWAGPAPSGPASQPATQLASAEKDLAQWWTAFGDPTLTSLATRAVESNLDLRLAEARIRQARAARGAAISGLGPTLNGSSNYTRSQASGGRGVRAPITDQYQAGFDAGWELDIFGGTRRNVEAAEADLRFAVEDRRDVLVTLSAEVASNYVALRAYQQRLVIARRNLQAQQQSAEITRKRLAGGLVSRLDVANADAQVASTTAAIPLLEMAARQTIYSLGVLLDLEPAALAEQLSPAGAIPAAKLTVPLGVPSDLLRRRPDIRRAEADIHAATARIGVAVADLYPHVTISGSLGFRASDLRDWFNPLSGFWSFGPGVSWSLFNTGANLANIDIRKALADQTILAYRKTVLTAMQEVENALIASAKEQERRKALVDAVAANRKAVELSTDLYSQGETEFLNVLNAQRSLYATEDALGDSEAAMSTDLIALYKALGGGWEE